MPSPFYPTPSQLLQIILDALRYAYAAQGIVPELGVGSDHYNRALAWANRASIAFADNQISLNNSNPLKATGPDLITLASIFGVFPRQPSFASGAVNIVSAGAVTIPAGFTGTIGSVRYQTTQAYPGAVSGASVNIVALVAGSAANQPPPGGQILTWDSAALGPLSQQATVTADGITNGVDGDGDPTGTNPAGDAPLRARLLEKLQAPPVGGNWSMAVEVATDASAAIEASYAYCGVQGPSSMDIACTAAGFTRQVATTTLALVRTAIAAVYPGQEEISVTAVTPAYEDVTLAAVLPLPIAAGGPGGGWTDAIPWPNGVDVQIVATPTAFMPPATGVAPAGQITVQDLSGQGPAVGNSFGMWDPDTTTSEGVRGLMYSGLSVSTVTSLGSDMWNIGVQPNLPSFATPSSMLGGYLSTGCVNLLAYAAAFAAAVAVLGPGQKTALPELLPRGLRQPTTDVSNRSDFTARLLDVLLNEFSELDDLQYRLTVLTGTSTPSVTTPPVPDTTADPPLVFVLQNFAIRKL